MIDSGCTNHMTGGKDMLVDFVDSLKSSSNISFGDNSKGKVLGLGKFVISSDSDEDQPRKIPWLGTLGLS